VCVTTWVEMNLTTADLESIQSTRWVNIRRSQRVLLSMPVGVRVQAENANFLLKNCLTGPTLLEMSGNPGGLNGWTQHWLEGYLQQSQALESAASLDSDGTPPWLGLIEFSRTVGFSIGKYCRTK
jgi:hypothetical protein